MTLTIDDDPVRRKPGGRIAVQIEGQGEVHFRNLRLRNWRPVTEGLMASNRAQSPELYNTLTGAATPKVG